MYGYTYYWNNYYNKEESVCDCRRHDRYYEADWNYPCGRPGYYRLDDAPHGQATQLSTYKYQKALQNLKTDLADDPFAHNNLKRSYSVTVRSYSRTRYGG